MPKITHYSNCRLVIDHRLEKGELWVQEGRFIAPQPRVDEEIDVQGLIVAPGYIDIHINGGFGIDFSQQGEKVEEVAQFLPKYGVTAFLPTLVSSSDAHYREALSHIREKMHSQKAGAKILGIHLEGPFFNPEECGAHRPDLIQTCDTLSSPEEVYGSLEGVKIVTLAPELKGISRLITFLHKKGIIASAGHTRATDQQMEEAIGCGVSLVTHLYNGMPSFHHRNPGIVGTVLTHSSLFYTLIGDPSHLNPKAVELAWVTHPEGLILITDAMAALGLHPGTYMLGTQEIEVDDGRALIKGTQTLAGSVIGMDSAVRYLRSCTGCSLVEAIEAASLKPAALLGLQHQKGKLQEGFDADFIFLNDALFVQASYIGGQLVWHHP